MSFQAYLDTIEARTGKSPAAERGWTADNGFAPGIKPMAIVAALKEELGSATVTRRPSSCCSRARSGREIGDAQPRPAGAGRLCGAR